MHYHRSTYPSSSKVSNADAEEEPRAVMENQCLGRGHEDHRTEVLQEMEIPCRTGRPCLHRFFRP